VAFVAAATVVALLVAIVCGLVIGPTSVPTWRVVGDIFAHVGIGHNTLTPIQSTVVWTLRAPRMVIGLLAGSMLAVAGGTYQGVFRNPLADPYLLGVASGAGSRHVRDHRPQSRRRYAELDAAPRLRWGDGGGHLDVADRRSKYAIEYGHVDPRRCGRGVPAHERADVSPATVECGSITRVYIWLLGSLASVGWGTVWLVFPYVIVCIMICVGAGRRSTS